MAAKRKCESGTSGGVASPTYKQASLPGRGTLNYNELGQCQELRQEVTLFEPSCFVEVAAILMGR